MATLLAPAPIGGAVSAFTDAFQRAQALRQQQERQQQLGLLAQLQITREQQAAQEAERARTVIPQILGAQPQPVEMVPAQAPQAGIVGQPGTPDEMGVMTPGRPALLEPALTPSMLAGQIGPEGLAAALTRPEGRAALALKGVISDEELAQRKRKRQALETFKSGLDEAERAWRERDPERGLLAEARAWRALGEVSDNSEAMFARASDAVKQYFKIHQDTQERELAGQDLQRIARAKVQFAEKPTPQNHAKMAEAAYGAQSDAGRRIAFQLAAQEAGGKMDEVQHAGFRQITARAAAIWAQQDQSAGRGDYATALRQAARENPEAAGQAFAAFGKDIPELWQRAFFGQVAPKSELDLAMQTAAGQNLLPGTPAHLQAVGKHLAELRGRKDQEVAQLVQQQDSMARRESSLQRELDKAEPGTRDAAELKAELDEVRGRLRGIKKDLEGRGALPKAVAAQTPALPESKKPPARSLAAPGSRDYQDRAVVEGQRLIRAGHDKASAIAAMRRQGWDVD